MYVFSIERVRKLEHFQNRSTVLKLTDSIDRHSIGVTSNLSVCRVMEEVGQWLGSAGRCGVLQSFMCAAKGRHFDENILDTIRLFNMEEIGLSTIQSTQEVFQIFEWVGLRTLLSRWNAWRYIAAQAASSGTKWSKEFGSEEDKNNIKTNYYEELNRFV